MIQEACSSQPFRISAAVTAGNIRDGYGSVNSDLKRAMGVQ